MKWHTFADFLRRRLITIMIAQTRNAIPLVTLTTKPTVFEVRELLLEASITVVEVVELTRGDAVVDVVELVGRDVNIVVDVDGGSPQLN
jgi:hypothetical protein